MGLRILLREEEQLLEGRVLEVPTTEAHVICGQNQKEKEPQAAEDAQDDC